VFKLVLALCLHFLPVFILVLALCLHFLPVFMYTVSCMGSLVVYIVDVLQKWSTVKNTLNLVPCH